MTILGFIILDKRGRHWGVGMYYKTQSDADTAARLLEDAYPKSAPFRSTPIYTIKS